MWFVSIAAALTSAPNALTSIFLAITLIVTTLHVLDHVTKSAITLLCGVAFLAACVSYFEPLATVLGLTLPLPLSQMEWGAYVSTHTMRSLCRRH